MPLNISQDDQIILANIIKEYIPQAKVWVFGSRAKGTATYRSDLDLAIDNGAPLGLPLTAQLRFAFSESRLPYFVDIVDWHEVSEEFKDLVKDTCIEVL
jgi:predicted nucleotidyltransferase